MITLDLPKPFSTNKSRRIDWATLKKHKDWIALADVLIMASRQNRQNAIIGPFEAHIVVSESVRTDLDNCIKVALDYVVRLKMVTDDGPDYLRKLTVEFGTVQGCRITLKPFKQQAPFVTGTIRRRIVDCLWQNRNGIATQDLLDAVYRDRRNGGSDHRSIYVISHHANKQLKPQGWKITATGGPGSVYRLVSITDA